MSVRSVKFRFIELFRLRFSRAAFSMRPSVCRKRIFRQTGRGRERSEDKENKAVGVHRYGRLCFPKQVKMPCFARTFSFIFFEADVLSQTKKQWKAPNRYKIHFDGSGLYRHSEGRIFNAALLGCSINRNLQNGQGECCKMAQTEKYPQIPEMCKAGGPEPPSRSATYPQATKGAVSGKEKKQVIPSRCTHRLGMTC